MFYTFKNRVPLYSASKCKKFRRPLSAPAAPVCLQGRALQVKNRQSQIPYLSAKHFILVFVWRTENKVLLWTMVLFSEATAILSIRWPIFQPENWRGKAF
jgi:hypothetical protein